jgi:hypothetical protein
MFFDRHRVVDQNANRQRESSQVMMLRVSPIALRTAIEKNCQWNRDRDDGVLFQSPKE